MTLQDIENIVNNLIYGEFHNFHNTWAAEGGLFDQMLAAYPLLDKDDIAGSISNYKDYELALLKMDFVNPAIKAELELLKFYKAIREAGYNTVQDFIDYLPTVLVGEKLSNAVTACTEAKEALTVLFPLVGAVMVTQLNVIVNGVEDINARIKNIPITGKI